MPASNVVPFQPTVAATLRIIREVAQDSARIRLGPAMPTVFSVGVSLRQILNCLKNGFISEGPHLDDVGFVCCELE